MKNLRQLRETNNLSQQKLIDELNLCHAQSQIQSYETGKYEPDIETMIQIADYFGTSVDYLIGRATYARNVESISDNIVNEAEQQLLSRYRRLLNKQRKSLFMFLETLDGEEFDFLP